MTSFAPTSRTSVASSTVLPKFPIAGYGVALLRWYDKVLQRRRLMNLDDRMLDDIGITRAQAEAESRKAGWSR